ncbi:MAG: cellulase family glycosylhydrolase [Thermoleophilaceae bacterium]|nr:cellulase family glycosylhydrolase [Thermoleophilaceae bacterium]
MLRRLAIALALLLLGAGSAHASGAGPVPPLRSDGRWITDATGRVVQLRGVNEVAKSAPYHPAAFGFGADDAEFLAEHGFNSVRLGVDFRGLMPEPGRVEQGYIDQLARTVQELGRRRIFVLIDFHQDGFAPKYNGNGLPDWMAIDDGLPNPPDAVFPLYYIQNPAMQRAFENLWANRPGPGGIGLQDYYAQGVSAVARRFARSPYVFGYDVMNEPFPGAAWGPCLTAAGCADLERRLTGPFNAKMTAAIRRWTRSQLVFVEPFVLFNFGIGPTSLPGRETGNGLSFHSYASSPAGEASVVDFAVKAAERDRAPVLATEFGATTSAATLERLTASFDARLVPWMFWAYNESVIDDPAQPAGLDNVASADGFRALVRPYPETVAGTPAALSFDPSTRDFELTYSTRGPSGRRSPWWRPSVVHVPELIYPEGYSVRAEGAWVVSRRCSESLVLHAKPWARTVTVKVSPAAAGCAR